MITIRSLVWDAWNIAHIARHDVSPGEVEDACRTKPYIVTGKKGRYMLIGPTKTGRFLAIILDPEPEQDVYYPVTARTADEKERMMYTTAMEEV